jgi:hypothetical protein
MEGLQGGTQTCKIVAKPQGDKGPSFGAASLLIALWRAKLMQLSSRGRDVDIASRRGHQRGGDL